MEGTLEGAWNSMGMIFPCSAEVWGDFRGCQTLTLSSFTSRHTHTREHVFILRALARSTKGGVPCCRIFYFLFFILEPFFLFFPLISFSFSSFYLGGVAWYARVYVDVLMGSKPGLATLTNA